MHSESRTETLRRYYDLQYVRVTAHETRQIQFSGAVLAGSVVALGLVIRPEKLPTWSLVVPVAVVAINVFAVLFVENARRWIKLHQARAEETLATLDADLLAMQIAVNRRHLVRGRSEDTVTWITATKMLRLTHAALVLVALVGAAAMSLRGFTSA